MPAYVIEFKYQTFLSHQVEPFEAIEVQLTCILHPLFNNALPSNTLGMYGWYLLWVLREQNVIFRCDCQGRGKIV